jgi:hypothetical protein
LLRERDVLALVADGLTAVRLLLAVAVVPVLASLVRDDHRTDDHLVWVLVIWHARRQAGGAFGHTGAGAPSETEDSCKVSNGRRQV